VIPFFSIIIPTFNAARTLSEALESLSLQNYKNFEVIIMDGLSTDDSLLIAKRYAKEFLIRIISEADKGIYDAMNKSVAIAKGKWIYFLGSDDRLFNENVLSTTALNIKEASDIVYGNSVWWPENVKEEGEWGYQQLLKRSINHQRIFYKRNLFERLGNFNLRYTIASDYEMNIRFFCNPGVMTQYVDFPVAYYHSAGFTGNKIDEDFWDNWKIISKNFGPYLSKSEICLRSGWYCWYKLHKKEYKKSILIFLSIFFKTFSISFLRHTVSQMLKIRAKAIS
jgi:glycosyltransferase involved in cell wall biosynthesis